MMRLGHSTLYYAKVVTIKFVATAEQLQKG